MCTGQNSFTVFKGWGVGLNLQVLASEFEQGWTRWEVRGHGKEWKARGVGEVGI